MPYSRTKSSALGICLALCVTACTSFGTLDRSSPAPAENESILVIGVKSANHRIYLFPGQVENGRFRNGLGAVLYSAPAQGYVVAKVEADKSYAIMGVRIADSESAVRGIDFSVCDNVQTMVFSAPKGKVVYAGTVEYLLRDNRLFAEYSADLVAARAFIDKSFPALAGKVEATPNVFLPTSRTCENKSTVIYIYR